MLGELARVYLLPSLKRMSHNSPSSILSTPTSLPTCSLGNLTLLVSPYTTNPNPTSSCSQSPSSTGPRDRGGPELGSHFIVCTEWRLWFGLYGICLSLSKCDYAPYICCYYVFSTFPLQCAHVPLAWNHCCTPPLLPTSLHSHLTTHILAVAAVKGID